MLLKGRVWKEEGFWLAEVKHLDLFTQAKTRQESLDLLMEQIEERYDFDKSQYSLKTITSSEIAITSISMNALVPLILKGLRNKEGLSVREVATRLGFKSRSSYFKYETGERSISIDQFDRIVKLIAGKSIVFELEP